MELRDLNAFITVVDTGFTWAAERLHLVQSAVSMAVRRLESEVDLVLVERRSGGAAPTRAGAALADHGRIILNSVTRARHDMEAYRGLSKGAVSIGILPADTPSRAGIAATPIAHTPSGAGGSCRGVEGL